MLAACPPRAFLYGVFEGGATFFEEGELLCSENCTPLTCFLNLFRAAAVQILEGSHGVSSLCVSSRESTVECCKHELT